MFMSDGERVRYSAGLSMSLHGALLGFYIFLKLTKPVETRLMLTRVEFLDLKPEPAATAGAEPAMARPRGVRDFLRMALPQFKRSAPEGPREAPVDKQNMISMSPVAAPISLKDDKPLARGPSAGRFEARPSAPSRAAGLSEIAEKTRAAIGTDLKGAPESARISLDAVGRSAARSSGGGSIRIDPNAALNRSGGFREIGSPTAAPSASASGMREASGGGIQIKDDAVSGRRGALSSGLPIGYGRGTSGISLAEKPIARPAAAALPEPVAAKAQSKVKTEIATDKTNKGIEISGPLAGRKIVNLFLPKYPDWARSQGIEADVVIRFFVDRDGRVLDRMILERTSGYQELDRLSMDALKKIVFVPLPRGEEDDQWGLITFRFRLK